MDINRYIKNQILEIKVVPNASQNKVVEENGLLKVYIKAVPDKNKANSELIKFFKKEFGLQVEIKSGDKSRKKLLRLL